MLKYFSLLLIILTCSLSVQATDGCVKNSDQTKIYTSFNSGNGKYNGSPTTPLAGGCNWNFTGGTCTVAPNSAGMLADVVQLCPLDDYSPFLLLSTILVGSYFLRKRALSFS